MLTSDRFIEQELRGPSAEVGVVWGGGVLSPTWERFGEKIVPPPQNFCLIFELKMVRFGAFWVLFLQLGCLCFTHKNNKTDGIQFVVCYLNSHYVLLFSMSFEHCCWRWQMENLKNHDYAYSAAHWPLDDAMACNITFCNFCDFLIILIHHTVLA